MIIAKRCVFKKVLDHSISTSASSAAHNPGVPHTVKLVDFSHDCGRVGLRQVTGREEAAPGTAVGWHQDV